MGSNWGGRGWLFTFLVFLSSSLSPFAVNSSGDSDSDAAALDASILVYANQTLSKRLRTGTLYDIPLPSNFSGMTAAVIRLRSDSFRWRGQNLSFVSIPPGVKTVPYGKRIVLIYQNLGDLSSKYYQVPGYTLISPVIGIKAYDDSNLTVISDQELQFNTSGYPISINFPNLSNPQNKTLQCVKFGDGGAAADFKNLTGSGVCPTRDPGHYCVVIASSPEKKAAIWRLWVIGFVGGLIGLVLLTLTGIFAVKLFRRRRIGKMEAAAEKGVAFDTFWIGGNKIPSAAMIRTQPVLEERYVP